eukprot:scaffold19997_cov84-Cyclotella_meneghiniana.AAC.5
MTESNIENEGIRNSAAEADQPNKAIQSLHFYYSNVNKECMVPTCCLLNSMFRRLLVSLFLLLVGVGGTTDDLEL